MECQPLKSLLFPTSPGVGALSQSLILGIAVTEERRGMRGVVIVVVVVYLDPENSDLFFAPVTLILYHWVGFL